MKTNGFHDLQRVEDITDKTIIQLLTLIKQYLETPKDQRTARRFYQFKKSLQGKRLPGINFGTTQYFEADLISVFGDDWDVAQHLFDVVSPDTTDDVTLTAKTLTAKQLLQAVDQHIQSAKYDVVNSVGRDGTIEICCDQHPFETVPIAIVPTNAHSWNDVDINWYQIVKCDLVAPFELFELIQTHLNYLAQN